MSQSNGSNFSEVLAGMVGAARQTEIRSGSNTPPPGEYHVNLIELSPEAKSNQYGPYVEAKARFRVIDEGDYTGDEFSIVYLISTTKDGKLNFSAQSFIQLAGVVAGEPIEDNNPEVAMSILQESANTGADVIKVRLFKRRSGYTGLEGLSLESAEPAKQ